MSKQSEKLTVSIFDELIILIDDQGSLPTPTIESFLHRYTRQAVGSTLGRLVSRGWLARTVNAESDEYRVTDIGNQYINQTLDAIHRAEQTWAGTWFCVVATLPESQRRERDMLRHYLTNRGFGRLVDGFWIHPWNRQDEVAHLIRRLGIGSSVFMFETQPIGQATLQVAISNGWNWGELHRRLGHYLEKTRNEVANLEQAHVDADQPLAKSRVRHQAKCLVFEYGMLLSADPTLPLAITPNQPLYKEARELYEQVRRYCY